MADPNAFTQLREAIPAIRHYVCLNSGGVAPTPQATLDLQQSFYDREAVMTTTSPDLRDVYNTELGALRAEIAALLGAEPDEIALIRAVSEAVSFVAVALELQPGDRVILTAAEHPSGYLAWLTLRDRLGLELVAIEADGDDQAFLRDMEAAMTPNTRAICLSHVTTERGIVLPVDGVSALARERGIVTVVDAAQSFGARPVDMQQLGCDVMAFPAFKWSMGAVRHRRHVRPSRGPGAPASLGQRLRCGNRVQTSRRARPACTQTPNATNSALAPSRSSPPGAPRSSC